MPGHKPSDQDVPDMVNHPPLGGTGGVAFNGNVTDVVSAALAVETWMHAVADRIEQTYTPRVIEEEEDE
jgi:hypothetical protein